MFLSWYKKFSSQPHQPFFTSGLLFFLFFITLLTLSYSDILEIKESVLTYHAYSMIFIVFIQFFLGFLFVVFPRFLMQAEIPINKYMNQFFVYFLSSIGFLLSLIFLPKMAFLFQLSMLIIQVFSFRLLYNIHEKSVIKPKEDTKWVLIAFGIGLVSHFLFIVSNFGSEYSYFVSKVAINSGFYLFLFMIIFTISQRMIPFFTTAKAANYKINKSPKLLETLFGLLVLKVVILSFDNAKLNLLADIPLFVIIVKELIRWKLPLFRVPAIMWVLYVGLYWIPVALVISIIEGILAFYAPDIYFEKAVIHTIALGYFVTVLVGFGTRVILGHSGTTPHANNFTIAIYVILQLVVMLRIFASFSSNFGFNYISLINLSAIWLIFIMFLWSYKYMAILLKGK